MFKNSSSVYKDSLNKIDFNFFLKQLKLSNFFISLGKNLYNLIPMLITLFWYEDYCKTRSHPYNFIKLYQSSSYLRLFVQPDDSYI